MINVMVHKANEELQLILRMHKQRHHVVCCSFSSFYSLTHSLTLSSFFLLLLRSQSMLWCTTHSNQKYHQVAFWRSFMLQTKYTIASVLMYICKSLGIYMRQKSFLFFLLLLLFNLGLRMKICLNHLPWLHALSLSPLLLLCSEGRRRKEAAGNLNSQWTPSTPVVAERVAILDVVVFLLTSTIREAVLLVGVCCLDWEVGLRGFTSSWRRGPAPYFLDGAPYGNGFRSQARKLRLPGCDLVKPLLGILLLVLQLVLPLGLPKRPLVLKFLLQNFQLVEELPLGLLKEKEGNAKVQCRAASASWKRRGGMNKMIIALFTYVFFFLQNLILLWQDVHFIRQRTEFLLTLLWHTWRTNWSEDKEEGKGKSERIHNSVVLVKSLSVSLSLSLSLYIYIYMCVWAW